VEPHLQVWCRVDSQKVAATSCICISVMRVSFIPSQLPRTGPNTQQQLFTLNLLSSDSVTLSLARILNGSRKFKTLSHSMPECGILFSLNFSCYFTTELENQMTARYKCGVRHLLCCAWCWESHGHIGKLGCLHGKVIVNTTNLGAIPNQGCVYLIHREACRGTG
jgi:hypothetical protein